MRVLKNLAVMVGAAAVAITIAMTVHNARADEPKLVPPPNAWQIVGDVTAIDDPSKFVHLRPYGENHLGEPASDANDSTIKYFASEEDCKSYLETEKLTTFVKKMNEITMKWHPPGKFSIYCRLAGEPV